MAKDTPPPEQREVETAPPSQAEQENVSEIKRTEDRSKTSPKVNTFAQAAKTLEKDEVFDKDAIQAEARKGCRKGKCVIALADANRADADAICYAVKEVTGRYPYGVSKNIVFPRVIFVKGLDEQHYQQLIKLNRVTYGQHAFTIDNCLELPVHEYVIEGVPAFADAEQVTMGLKKGIHDVRNVRQFVRRYEKSHQVTREQWFFSSTMKIPHASTVSVGNLPAHIFQRDACFNCGGTGHRKYQCSSPSTSASGNPRKRIRGMVMRMGRQEKLKDRTEQEGNGNGMGNATVKGKGMGTSSQRTPQTDRNPLSQPYPAPAMLQPTTTAFTRPKLITTTPPDHSSEEPRREREAGTTNDTEPDQSRNDDMILREEHEVGNENLNEIVGTGVGMMSPASKPNLSLPEEDMRMLANHMDDERMGEVETPTRGEPHKDHHPAHTNNELSDTEEKGDDPEMRLSKTNEVTPSPSARSDTMLEEDGGSTQGQNNVQEANIPNSTTRVEMDEDTPQIKRSGRVRKATQRYGYES